MYWREQVYDILQGWQRTSDDLMTLSTFVKPGWSIVRSHEVAIFPDSKGRKSNRTVLHTVIRSCTSAEQRTWNVWNNHTVSGSLSVCNHSDWV